MIPIRRSPLLPSRRALLSGAAGLALAQRAALAGPASPPRPYAPPRAEEWAVSSRAGRDYRILLSWPEGPPPAAGFPVLYALDGAAFFDVLTASMRWRPAAAQGIVAAIDFPEDEADRRRRDREFLPGGPQNAAALLDFIATELEAALAARLPLDAARRGLFGHSYGGLFALHALFTRPALFRTVLAASPSVWWKDRAIEHEAEAYLRAPPPPVPPRLLLTYGSEERRRGDTTRLGMGEGVEGLAALLRDHPAHLETLSVQAFPGEGHGSVRAAAANRAIDFCFPATGVPRRPAP
ncbi:alpha/beta hydrolase [Teichococcus aerofrigidensis]